MRRLVCCCALLALGISPAWARMLLFDGGAPTVLGAAFYVATTGSDSNAGTLASPFLTLGKCQAALKSGYLSAFPIEFFDRLRDGGLLVQSIYDPDEDRGRAGSL